MRKIREVLRLCFDHKLGQREIARSAVVSQSTVHEYLARFAASGLTWPLPTDMSETSLEAKLYPKPGASITVTAKKRPLTHPSKAPLPRRRLLPPEVLRPRTGVKSIGNCKTTST